MPRSVKTNRTNGEAPHPTKGNGPPSCRAGANGESAGGATRDTPTDLAAMQDVVAFVDAVAARENLVGVAVSLLRSKDEKVKQRMLERSLDMTFGKPSGASGAGDEPLQVIPDLPRPDSE